jgi:hypothetical protein
VNSTPARVTRIPTATSKTLLTRPHYPVGGATGVTPSPVDRTATIDARFGSVLRERIHGEGEL